MLSTETSIFSGVGASVTIERALPDSLRTWSGSSVLSAVRRKVKSAAILRLISKLPQSYPKKAYP